MPKEIAVFKVSLSSNAEDIGELIEVLEKAGFEIKGEELGVYSVHKPYKII